MKKFKLKSALVASIGALLFSGLSPTVYAFTNQNSTTNTDGVNIEVKQIKELSGKSLFDYTGKELPTQVLASTLAHIVQTDTISQGTPEYYSGVDVMKYLYPKDTDEQLKNELISAEQALSWLNSVGYSATITNRALTTDEIKKNLDNAQPMLTILTGQNDNDWLHKQEAGILYAHDDVEAGDSKLHASFIMSYDHEDMTIQDGQEANAFQFSDASQSVDDSQRTNTFKWTQTISNFKRDPSWNNRENIREDRKNGIFTTTLSKEGENVVQADFTDDDVKALWGLHKDLPISVSTTKVDAVALVNLYMDATHQKTVEDFDDFAKISEETPATTKQIEDWLDSLGFSFDTTTGKVTKELTKSLGSEGKLYLSVVNATEADNPRKNEAIIGAGFADNTEGYTPNWVNVKAEQINPQYQVDWSLPNAMDILEKKMKAFDYDTILRDGYLGSTYYDYNYNADTLIYNIKEKDKPNGVANSFTKSLSSKQEVSTSVDYATAPDFAIRETQGQEPWCAEYVNAAAVNTVEKATQAGNPVTSAKTLMQLIYPGVPDSELSTMGGGTIENNLSVMQKNYGVTADVENKTLNFEQVKKEVDSDNIVQIDAYDSKETAPPGSSDNVGHSLAIVGYVLPPSGSDQTPYYEVWNPWWRKSIYVSVNSDTIRLGGTDYKWTRTWHNWRKIDKDADLNISKSIGKQKVANASNPNSTDSKINFADVLQPFNQDNILKQRVSEMNPPVYCKDTHGTMFGYMLAVNKSQIVAMKNTDSKRRTYSNNSQATTRIYKDSIDNMSLYFAKIARYGFSTAIAMALIIAVQFIPVVDAAADVIMGFFGMGITWDTAVDLAQNISSLVKAQNAAKDSYNNL